MKKFALAAVMAAAIAAPALHSTEAKAQWAVAPVGSWLPTAWIAGGVVGVMINAAITYKTECRELTSTEALTALALPGVGTAFNVATSKTNKCGKAPVRAKY